MNREIEYSNYKELTTEIKERHWGSGEWIKEPDAFVFQHSGFTCCGIRQAGWDGLNNEHLFGGYWCGYIKLPLGHEWHSKSMEDIDVECHYGLSLCRKDPESEDWVIGFDCAHSGDLCPSLEETRHRFGKDSKYSWLNEDELKQRLPNSILFHREYRTIEYVINQCKSMAEQASSVIKDS